MSRGGRVLRPILLGLALAVIGLPPSIALGGDRPREVLASPIGMSGAVELPGTALAGAVADITADGAREIVRLVPGGADRAHLAVEAWRVAEDEWRRFPQRPVARRGVLREAPATWWQRPDRDGMAPVRPGEPARLVAWNDGQRERLLLFTAGSPEAELACCLAIHEVLSADGELRLSLLATDAGPASEVHALDMSGDGIDELIVLGPVGDNEARATVLSWSGGRFVSIDESPIPVERSAGMVLESDGRPGSELLLSGRGPAPVAGGRAWSLLRLSLADGVLVREQARAPVVLGPGLIAPWLAEPGMLITDFDGTITRVRWPAGERLISEQRSSVRGYPLAVIGRGDASRVLLLEGSFLAAGDDGALLRVLDDELVPLRQVRPADAALQFRETDRALDGSRRAPRPFIGELPGGLPDGRRAFIFDGQLIAALADGACQDDCLSVEPTALLPGMVPIGVAGPDGGWLAVARSERAFGDAQRTGGPLATPPYAEDAWSVMPTGSLLAPRAESLSLDHRGEAAHPSLPGLTLSPPGGFQTELMAPPGSLLYVAARDLLDGPHVVGPEGRLLLSMPPQAVLEFPDATTVRLLLVTPTGGGEAVDVEVSVLREPPEIEIEAGTAAFSFSVPLTGRASAGATLTVDGRRVAVDGDGRFETQVQGGPWPRTIEAVAADPFGRVTRESLTVIGFIDYRRLPWPGIVLALTIAAALAVYLLAPRAGRRAARLSGEGSALEELSDE